MPEARERRAVPRTTLAEPPAARVRGVREVRLRDLSLAGAQIEHLDLVRLRASCTLDFPPAFGVLSLPAEVVWCTVIGRRRKLREGSHLVARTGLRFPTLTAAQHAALVATLQELAPQPIA
jgi:hypothetical protein